MNNGGQVKISNVWHFSNELYLTFTFLPPILAQSLTVLTLKMMYCTDVRNMTLNLLLSKSALPWGL